MRTVLTIADDMAAERGGGDMAFQTYGRLRHQLARRDQMDRQSALADAAPIKRPAPEPSGKLSQGNPEKCVNVTAPARTTATPTQIASKIRRCAIALVFAAISFLIAVPKPAQALVADSKGDRTYNISKSSLTYCVSIDDRNYRNILGIAIKNAAQKWGKYTGTSFTWKQDEDGQGCNKDLVRRGVVDFIAEMVSAKTAGIDGLGGIAFFPGAGWGLRVLGIQEAKVKGTTGGLSLDYTVLHEVGHILGFRHEWLNTSFKGCATGWKPPKEPGDFVSLTIYDPNSIMNYPQCSNVVVGRSSGNLSTYDQKGACIAYLLHNGSLLPSSPCHQYVASIFPRNQPCCGGAVLPPPAPKGRPFASIQGISGLYHTSQNENTCINNPHQSTTDGTQIVVNQNCKYDDAASMWIVNQSVGMRQGTGNMVNTTHRTKCMDNKFGNQSNGNPIVIWTCNSGNTQNWDWDDTTFHYHANPNKCVSVKWNNPNNTDGFLVLWDCNRGSNQNFAFTNPPVTSGGGGRCGNRC
jgi:Ricin-type beta-trefoil lectin domain